MAKIRITPGIFALMLVPVSLFAQEMTLQTLLRQHRSAQAEVSRMVEANTLRLSGETSQQGATFNFTLYKKSPNLLRYEIDYKTRQVAIIFDGENGYYLYLDEPQRPAVLASGEQRILLEQEAFFAGPLISAAERGYRMVYKGRTEIHGHDNAVYQVELTDTDSPAVMEVYLDAYSFLEVSREVRPTAEAKPLVTYFSDFRDVQGFKIPYRVENYFDGKLVSSTKVKDVSIDVGILGYFFEKPTDRQIVSAE